VPARSQSPSIICYSRLQAVRKRYRQEAVQAPPPQPFLQFAYIRYGSTSVGYLTPVRILTLLTTIIAPAWYAFALGYQMELSRAFRGAHGPLSRQSLSIRVAGVRDTLKCLAPLPPRPPCNFTSIQWLDDIVCFISRYQEMQVAHTSTYPGTALNMWVLNVSHLS